MQLNVRFPFLIVTPEKSEGVSFNVTFGNDKKSATFYSDEKLLLFGDIDVCSFFDFSHSENEVV